VWEKWEARGPRTPPRLGSRAWQNEGGGAAPMGLALASGSACPILLPAGWHGSARVLPSNSPFARGGGLRSGVCTLLFARLGLHSGVGAVGLARSDLHGRGEGVKCLQGSPRCQQQGRGRGGQNLLPCASGSPYLGRVPRCHFSSA